MSSALAKEEVLAVLAHLREMLQTEEPDPARWLAQLSLDPITAPHGEQMQLL